MVEISEIFCKGWQSAAELCSLDAGLSRGHCVPTGSWEATFYYGGANAHWGDEPGAGWRSWRGILTPSPLLVARKAPGHSGW